MGLWNSFLQATSRLTPLLFLVFSTGFVILVTYFVARFQVDRRWRQNIRHHLPDVIKDEIDSRDSKIKVLTQERDKHLRELEEQRVRVRAALNLANRVNQILSGDMRYETPNTDYFQIFQPGNGADESVVEGKRNGKHLEAAVTGSNGRAHDGE